MPLLNLQSQQSFRPCTNLLTSFYIYNAMTWNSIKEKNANQTRLRLIFYSIAFMIYCVLVIDIWLEVWQPFCLFPPRLTIVFGSCERAPWKADFNQTKTAKIWSDSESWSRKSLLRSCDNDVFIHRASFIFVCENYNWARELERAVPVIVLQ